MQFPSSGLPLCATPEASDDELDFRQLRHHTKNALQRIIGLIAESPELQQTPQGARLARELEQRICLSAAISNALFGMTRAPGSMAERLRTLGRSIVALMGNPGQAIRLDVQVSGTCPAEHRSAVLRVAHELVGNAVRHGMHARASGCIIVQLVCSPSGTILTVRDDGWGFEPTVARGEGLGVASGLALQLGGTLELRRDNGTLARLELPVPPAQRPSLRFQSRSSDISSSSTKRSANFRARRSMP
ncbi:MAG: sensor histidine kinase [Acetobacteraceae bacterium]|nr:sensor histidine kinase [Acetobacteraceae bacterium]